MRRRIGKPTFSISKASLPALQKKEIELKLQIEKFRKGVLSDYVSSSIKKKIHILDSGILLLRQETHALRSNTVIGKGLVSRIFKIHEIPESSALKISDNERRMNEQHQESSALKNQLRDHEYHLNRSISFEKDLLKIETRIRQIKDKQDLINSLKNKAAETAKDKRVIGETVKRVLPRHKNCPYCGIKLDASAHADHIYPIAKGGESTIKNMVWACFTCNSKKSHLTLQAFIKKYDLDRDSIEKRLTELKKDF